VFGVLLFSAVAAPSHAGAPADQMRGTIEKVLSVFTTKKGEEIAVNYKLHQVGSDWKVYDVVIENISLVNNYRSQFNRVIAQSSFEDLLRRMKDKQFQASAKSPKT